MSKTAVKYWLFQSSPKVFQLKEALADDAVKTFAVKAHKKLIKKGDKVILWQSGKKAGCYALATVETNPKIQPISDKETPYFQATIKEGLRVNLKIEYNLWNRPITKEILPNSTHFEAFYGGVPGTNFHATQKQFEELIAKIETLDIINEPEINYLKNSTSLHSLNTILHGPPGTGKTYQTVNYALSIIENRSLKELAIEPRKALRERFEQYQDKGQIQFVTFHQSYTYEDFVEGIKPVVREGQVHYEIENGIFKQITYNAKQCLLEAHTQKIVQKEADSIAKKTDASTLIDLKEISDQVLKNCRKYVLIIDEINRGNISAIFGELISMIEPDKREGRQEAIRALLPYSKKTFAVPPNLYILGTMNTSGRSIEPLDIALRRRFHFIETPPKPALLRPAIEAGVNLEKLLTAINKRIEALLDKEFMIGHAYFFKIHTLEDLKDLFAKKIIPLLSEYFFGDFNKIGLVLGRQFFKQNQIINKNIFGDFDADFVEELTYKKIYEIKHFSDWTEADFIKVYDKNYEA